MFALKTTLVLLALSSTALAREMPREDQTDVVKVKRELPREDATEVVR